jgi:hypothetical protein
MIRRGKEPLPQLILNRKTRFRYKNKNSRPKPERKA